MCRWTDFTYTHSIATTGLYRYQPVFTLPVPVFVARRGRVLLSVAGGAAALSLHTRADGREPIKQLHPLARRRFVLPDRGDRSRGAAGPHSGWQAEVKQAPPRAPPSAAAL